MSKFDEQYLNPLVDGICCELIRRGVAYQVKDFDINTVNGQPVKFSASQEFRGYDHVHGITISYLTGHRHVRQSRPPQDFKAEKIAANLIEAAEKVKAFVTARDAEFKAERDARQIIRNLEHDAGLPKHCLSQDRDGYELSLHDLTREQCLAIGKALARAAELRAGADGAGEKHA